MAKKNILVTGGAGFVGGILTSRLIKDGYGVVVVDDLSNGKRSNVPERAEFIAMNLAEEGGYVMLAEYNFEAVIHCAAQSSNAISFENPKADLMSNQLATLNLLDFCRNKKIKRIIFTSSMSAYGRAKIYPTPEDEPCYPDSFYAVHKLASEHYVRIYAQEHDLKTTVFRLYTTYGYGQNLENTQQGLLSIYLSYLLKKIPLVVKGSGDRVRDIVYVEDVVDAICLSLNNVKTYGKTYNLGTGDCVSIDEIIYDLLSGLGYDPATYPVVWEGSTPGDPPKTQALMDAIATDTGWRPRVTPKEGIRRTLEIFLNAAE